MTIEERMRETHARIKWKSDAEAQYRAGFEEGASASIREIKEFLPPTAIRSVEAWLSELDAWRVDSRRAVAEGREPAIKLPPSLTIDRRSH